MTVLQVIQRGTEFLTRKGVESPRLQAELLLAHALKLPRMQLYLNFERELTEAELASSRDLVTRRGQREPLQQIVGSTSFCGFEIAVDRRVLVPRPETELLAEQGWQFLNHLSGAGVSPASEGVSPSNPNAGQTPATTGQTPAPLLALDFGTGSGCLAIALAAKCPRAQVYALDLSDEALQLARQNAARHDLAGRIQFFQGDGFAALPGTLRFHLIVGNPPYIPSEEIAGLEPEVRDFEPRQALDGGADGLACYRRLAAEAGGFLRAGGRLMMEFGDGQAVPLRELFEQQLWVVEAVLEDYTQRPRILVARRD